MPESYHVRIAQGAARLQRRPLHHLRRRRVRAAPRAQLPRGRRGARPARRELTTSSTSSPCATRCSRSSTSSTTACCCRRSTRRSTSPSTGGDAGEVVATHGKRRWVFPRQRLRAAARGQHHGRAARPVHRRQAAAGPRRPPPAVTRLEVAVDECDGQWGVYRWTAGRS